ncbi:MAG: chitobiase/beta-hexosaminidase C-terminal domain-containing protein [Myxococcaceae bacterium]
MRTPTLVGTLFLTLALALTGCGQKPGPLQFEPNAELGPPGVHADPPAGPFNDKITITFTADRPATIYYSTNGEDPRTSSVGRVSGASPLKLEVSATTTVKYFASVGGKDGELTEGKWIRAGGPKGTISGVVVVGGYAVNKQMGVFRNTSLQNLPLPTMPGEVPFKFEGLQTGTHRLTAISDRNDDGNLIPFLDFQSPTVAVDLDLSDPYKAGPEGIRLYLGASGSGLGTLRGTITLPKPPPLQNLQISILDPSALSGGLDPQALLQQLQGGYRIFTLPTQTEYPYVITDLMPGRVTPVPSLIGFANGGVAINLLANPLQPVTIIADQETVADFAFGPVTITGDVVLGSMSAPTGGLGFGIVAARAASITEGLQSVLMPVIFTQDTMTNTSRATYSGSAFRGNATINLRVFTNANGANPLTDALQWVVNPFAAGTPHATVNTTTMDVAQNITLP